MAINLKAKETLIQVGEMKGQYRFILGTELYNKLSESKVIKEAAIRSGVSVGVMQVCWDAAGEVIKAWCTEGHSVAVPGLGTMRFGVRAKSVPTVGEVATSLITNRRVIFTPSVDIKRELQETSIQITCYDRNGKVVKSVTSDDKGDVENPIPYQLAVISIFHHKAQLSEFCLQRLYAVGFLYLKACKSGEMEWNIHSAACSHIGLCQVGRINEVVVESWQCAHVARQGYRGWSILLACGKGCFHS